jgi:hypothetical protein
MTQVSAKPSEKALQQTRFECATKVLEWNSWVYWPDSPDLSRFIPEGQGADGYYASVQVMLEAIADYNATTPEPLQIPAYVWCCPPAGVQQFDAEELMIHEFESLYEGAWNQVPTKAILNLDTALREFYKATQHINVPRESYHYALLVGVCPAQVERSEHYPKEWGDRVPKTIRMLETVQSDIPFMSRSMAIIGEEYPAWTNSHGAVSAVLPGDEQLGVKPGEFEIVEWWESDGVSRRFR